MEESDIEGVAIHGGPESCVSHPRGGNEALTGGVQAGLLSREITATGVPTPCQLRKAILRAALSRVANGPRAVEEPRHVRKLHAREPGEPTIARQPDHLAGRSGKAEAVSPR